MAEEEEEAQGSRGPPAIRDHFSRSVRDVGDELDWGQVTSWQIVHILLRNHAQYGGSSLLPLEDNTGTLQLVDIWFSQVADHFDLAAVRASEREVIDGRMTILGLTWLDPYLAAALEEAGFRKRLQDDLGPGLSDVLKSPQADRARPEEETQSGDGTFEVQALAGHEGQVYDVAIGSLYGADFVISGGADGTVRIWDSALTPAGALEGHRGAVRAVAIGRVDERDLIVSGGIDGTVRLWSPTDLVHKIQAHEGWTQAVALGRFDGGDLIVSGGQDGVVRTFDQSGEPHSQFNAHPGGVVSLAAGALQDEGVIVSGDADGNVTIWDVSGRQLQESLAMGHIGQVFSVAIGRLSGEPAIASAGANVIRLWDSTGRQRGRPLFGHDDLVLAVTVGRLGSDDRVVSGGVDGTVRLWDSSGQPVGAPLLGHEGRVEAVAIGPLGGRDVVASAGEDGTVRIWSPSDREVDAIELVGDLAATEDELGRAPIAQDLGRRLARIHHDDRHHQGSFLVHLDGPWGAGKSSILNFLRDDLEGRGPEPREPAWLVVDFNAWRERRARPPWRALLASLRAGVRSELTLLGRARFWFAELRRRVSQIGATGLIATMLLTVAVVALVLAWVSGGLTTVAALVTTAATLVALVIAAARASGRFLFWGSERSAETFEETEEKPMQRLADHFSWLIELVGEQRLRRRPWTRGSRLPTRRSAPPAERVHHSRPTIFFIDDLDRCQAEHVVELMEAVQNLIRDAGSGRGPYFVIAADGRWIRRSYESSFERFGETVAEPGRPLGYLFLDKLFQMSVQVPSMTGGEQDGFMGRLLRVGADAIPPPEQAVQEPPSKQELLDRVDRGAREEDFTVAVSMAGALPAAERQEVVARVVEREAETGQAKKTAHRLQPYARHLPPNPRTMKRFINAYEIARAVDRVEGRAVTPEKRAIWTVLRLRWPVLADHLQGDPELLDALEAVDPATEDLTVRLLAGGDVRRLLVEAEGAPFTAGDLRACCGVEEPLVLPVASASSSVPA